MDYPRFLPPEGNPHRNAKIFFIISHDKFFHPPASLCQLRFFAFGRNFSYTYAL